MAAPETTPLEAQHTLSSLGEHYLADLLAHARGMAALATPTVNGFERFRPSALAPQSILWGHDNRGAMLLRIPLIVTRDSGIVTRDSGHRDRA